MTKYLITAQLKAEGDAIDTVIKTLKDQLQTAGITLQAVQVKVAR